MIKNITSQVSVGLCVGWIYQWSQPLLYVELLPAHKLTDLLSSVFQERQRLETILSLCAEYTKPDSRVSPGTTVADVQKINKELEKDNVLKVNHIICLI